SVQRSHLREQRVRSVLLLLLLSLFLAQNLPSQQAHPQPTCHPMRGTHGIASRRRGTGPAHRTAGAGQSPPDGRLPPSQCASTSPFGSSQDFPKFLAGTLESANLYYTIEPISGKPRGQSIASPAKRLRHANSPQLAVRTTRLGKPGPGTRREKP